MSPSGKIAVLGVPTSAGAHHAGQDAAPAALRQHGLLDELRKRGMQVRDVGDLPRQVFAVDRANPRCRNLEAVLGVARGVADAVEGIVDQDEQILVLGGDCTITLGVVAGVQRVHADAGLVYLDGDSDMRGPERTQSGILDNSGIAQLLGLADTPLASLDRPPPMLRDDRLVMLGFDDDDADYDAQVFAAHPGLRHVSGLELRESEKPADLASDAVTDLVTQSSTVIVHFDVDVVTSGDLPLGNFPHYETGLDLETAKSVLKALCSQPKLGPVVLTEVNPSYDPTGEQLKRYIEVVSDALAYGNS